MVELGIPLDDKITKFLFEKGVIKQKDGKISPKRRQSFITLSDLEIVSAFNAESGVYRR